jgi:molybdopterin converting factor small subunit
MLARIDELHKIKETCLLSGGSEKIAKQHFKGELTHKINVHTILHHITKDQGVVQVDGDTVGQCLEQLVARFPGLKKVLFDSDGKLLNYIDVYVNGESSYPEESAKCLKNGDELHIELIIAGG